MVIMLEWWRNMKDKEYKRICLMIPTYQRPERLETILNSVYDTVSDINSLCISLCVNKSDEITRQFIKDYNWPNTNYEVIDEETKQPNLSYYFNLMYNQTRFKDCVVSEIGDDMIFKTNGWDEKILKAINDTNGLGIVYCNDDYIAHDKCCVNLFVTRKLVGLTKKPFMCEFFHADMIDMVWTMVGAMAGLLYYLEDVIIFHNHSSITSKDQWDYTFQRLAPVQRVANSEANRKLAIAYSTIVARNLIENGVGEWNVLQ